MTGDTPVDPRAVPGSYEKTDDGFVRLEAATAPAEAETIHAGMDLETARAIADANAASGFPPPPGVQAVIDAAAADAKAEAKATKAAAKTQTPPPATPAEPPTSGAKE